MARVYPFQVLLAARQTGLSSASKARAEQVRSVSIERVGKVTGRLPAVIMSELDHAMRVHLAL